MALAIVNSCHSSCLSLSLLSSWPVTGNCSIGRPSGEQEPRGVSVSRCKACWLKICLEKFVLESNIREVIEQHYLPVFLTGPSGTVVTPASSSIVSSTISPPSSTSPLSTSSAGTFLSSPSNQTTAAYTCSASSTSSCSSSSLSSSNLNDNRSKSTNDSIVYDNLPSNVISSADFSSYSSAMCNSSSSNHHIQQHQQAEHNKSHQEKQQPPPLPLPQRKRRPKAQMQSSSGDIETTGALYTSNSVLPPSYSPSSSSISSTTSLNSSSTTTTRTRNTRNTRKGPTTVKYKKCEQKSVSTSNGNRHIRNRQQSTKSKLNQNTNLTINKYQMNRSNNYDSHQEGYLLTPPADSDNEMDSFISNDTNSLINSNSTNIMSSNTLFRPITPCSISNTRNRNGNNKRDRSFDGTSSVKVKKNNEILSLSAYSKSLSLTNTFINSSSSHSPLAENISPDKMILGKRSRGAKGVIGYNHDHDYGASHETENEIDDDEEDDDECYNKMNWNNSINNNVHYSTGSEDDATEDDVDDVDYDNNEQDDDDDEEDDDDDDFEATLRPRQRIGGRRRNLNGRQRQKKSLQPSHGKLKHQSNDKVLPGDLHHTSLNNGSSNCTSLSASSSSCNITGSNVTVHSAIDSCDEYIDESYIKSQTDLPEYLSSLHSTACNLISIPEVTKSNGSRFKKFKSDPDSPKAATKAEESMQDYHSHHYSTHDLLTHEVTSETRTDVNCLPRTVKSAAVARYNRLNVSKGKRGAGKTSGASSTLPSTSSAFTCPLSVKGGRKASVARNHARSRDVNSLESASSSSSSSPCTAADTTASSSSVRHHLNSLSSSTSSSTNEFCDLIDYHNNSSHELLHSSTSGHQMLHQIDEDDEGYDDYFDPLVNTTRESRDSLFFDEILNTNSPFL